MYYGYSKQEWDSLSEAEKTEVKDSYKRIVARKNEIVNGDARADASNAFVERAVDKERN